MPLALSLRAWRSLASLALALLFTAALASPLAGQRGSVQGIVRDARTGEGIPGVQVTVAGTEVGGITDASGVFRLEGVPAGRTRILFQAQGFASVSREVVVPPGEEGVTLRVSLEVSFGLPPDPPARPPEPPPPPPPPPRPPPPPVREDPPPLAPDTARAEPPVYNALLSPLAGRAPLRLTPGERAELRFFIGAPTEESVLGGDASIAEAVRMAREPTPLGLAFDCHVCTEETSQGDRVVYDPATGTSDEARFTFTPRRSAVEEQGGLGRLVVTVSREGVELDAVEIHVLVGEGTEAAVEAYRAPAVHRVSPLPAEVVAAPDLVLYVGPAAGTAPVPIRLEVHDGELEESLDALLGGAVADRVFESGVSQADLEELARNVYLRLSDVVLAENPRLDSLYAGQSVGPVTPSSSLRFGPADSAAVVAALDQEGRELFRRLFAHGSAPLPAVMAAVERVGRARQARGEPLHVRVHNTGPWVPWQLLAPVWEGSTPDPERFWGLRYALGVRQSLPGRDGPIATTLPWPRDEELVMATHRHEDRIAVRAEGLLGGLARSTDARVQRFDASSLLLEELRADGDELAFLLVFTHGRSGGADAGGFPARPQLIFAADDVLVPANVDALGDAVMPTVDGAGTLLLRDQPVVFLNACETGTAGLRPTTNNNFVGSFLRLGASAVVATESSVGIGFASSFAGDFSEEVFRGVPVAEAMRRTRRKHLAEKGSALGLVYSLYGNPSARFIRPTPGAGP
jgi:hypothetical protein